jgi:hypothetical protein
MGRRGNRRGNQADRSQPRPPLSSPQPAHFPGRPPVSVGSNRATQAPPHLSDDFKGIFERAADRARGNLASTGTVGPTVFFVYTDGTMKVLSFTRRHQLQPEELIRRIREKALAESASAVLVLTEAEHGPQGKAVLSGATSGMTASVLVEYGFDQKTKTVTSWKISWLDKPVQNMLLEGIFDNVG